MAKKKASAESTVRTIRRRTRKKYSAEDKIRKARRLHWKSFDDLQRAGRKSWIRGFVIDFITRAYSPQRGLNLREGSVHV